MASSSTDGSTGPQSAEPTSEWQVRHPVVIVSLLILITEVFAFEYVMVIPGLPNIAAEFGTPQISLVQSVPLLISAVVVPLLAKLGDIQGKKRVLLLGSVVFVAGSVLCALAQSYPLFLVGRALQSFGLVGTVIAYGLIRDLLPPRLVPIGIGFLGTGFGASAIIGSVGGAALVDAFGFRSVFWFLTIYAVVIGLLVLALVPETRVRIDHRIDLAGGLLLGLGAGALVVASTFGSYRLLSVVLGFVLLVLFVIVERRTEQPLISTQLLARPAVAMTMLAASAVGFVIGAGTLLTSLMLRTPKVPGAEHGLGMSATEYALGYGLVLGVAAAVCGFLAGVVSRSAGPRVALLISTAAFFVAMTLVATGFIDTVWKAAVIGALQGVGQGFFYASTANLVVEAVPATVQGVSSSVKYTIEQGIGAIAAAVVGSIIAGHVIPVPGSEAVVYGTSGFQTAYWLLAVLSALGFAVAVLMRHGRSPATGGIASGTEV